MNQINEAPPAQGRPESLPDGAFEALCDLLFSHDSLSQHKGDSMQTALDHISILESITKQYFKDQGKTLTAKYLYD